MRTLSCLLVVAFASAPALSPNPGFSQESESPDARIFALARRYFDEFQDPSTGILYGARLSGRSSWTSPADVLKEKPHPWGYGSRIADTVLHTGHMLVALLDAWEAHPAPFLEDQIRRHFEGLKRIGSLPETHPKEGKPDLEGLVPRGPHPDDHRAWFDDSSMDQHTTYLISLAIFSRSELASEEDRKWIAESLGKVGRRLERHDWSIKRADGETQAHVGFSWKGFNSGHVSILLPAVLALYEGTRDPHWLERYEEFLSEADGKRWQQAHSGPHVRINGHPIYANQNAFRVNAWYRMEKDPERRSVIAGLLKQSTEMQLARDFPGEFYRKHHSEETWKRIQSDFSWGDSELRGARAAWDRFDPAMLEHDEKGLAALAHVRFPLGGFHMVLLSENETLIRQYASRVQEMLQSVDLEQIDAGETHYLFTVVALHLYALAHSYPSLLDSTDSPGSPFGRELPMVADAEIGSVMDVAVEKDRAFAIGGGKLHVLDLSDPGKPILLGQLSGLGSVRQVVVRDGIAYVSSRQDGLFIVDVSTPKNPKLLDHYDTIEFATGLAISGDILFVACRHYGVELVDVSTPSRPSHISTVRTGEAQSVVARDGYLYVGVWASSEVVTVDARDPWNPTIVHRAELDGFGDGVDVRGSFLYAATGHHSRSQPRKKPGDPGFGKGHGLEIFDLTDPAAPRWLSRLKFPELYEIGNDMWSVTVTNDHAFVADTWNGIFVVDVSDASNPRCVAHRKLPYVDARKANGFVGGIAVIQDHILAAGGYTDLHVIGAGSLATTVHGEPDSAPEVGPEPTRAPDPDWRVYQPGTQVHGVTFLEDDRAVVACGRGGVHVLRLWPETELLSTFPTEGFATDVAAAGGRVYVAESFGGLSVCEVDPATSKLVEVGRYRHGNRAIRQVEIPGVDELVMAQAGANQFLVLDASDPANPALLLEDTRFGLLYGDQMMRGLVDDRYTCVFWHVSGIHWYDLRGDDGPKFSGNNYPERLGSSNGLMAFGSRVLAPTRGGYLILDREEQRPLSEIGVTPVGNKRGHLGVPMIAGDRLFTSVRAYGIVTEIDIADPENPRLIEAFETPGNPSRVEVRRDSLIIPDGYSGLRIRKLRP